MNPNLGKSPWKISPWEKSPGIIHHMEKIAPEQKKYPVWHVEKICVCVCIY